MVCSPSCLLADSTHPNLCADVLLCAELRPHANSQWKARFFITIWDCTRYCATGGYSCLRLVQASKLNNVTFCASIRDDWFRMNQRLIAQEF